jgi:hypothetical protein
MPLLQSSLSMSDIASHAMITLALLIAVLWLRRWPLVYAFSILPGTIAHELLHFLAGWVMGAKHIYCSVSAAQSVRQILPTTSSDSSNAAFCLLIDAG